MAWTSYENSGGVMAEGDYEVICLRCEQGETKTGIPCIKFDFLVRSDVEQKYQKKHVFKSFFQDENGEWPREKIGKYANALGIPKGESFELADLERRCCILHMRPYTGNDGVTRDSICWTAATKAEPPKSFEPDGKAEAPAAPAGGGFVQVDEEELPF